MYEIVDTEQDIAGKWRIRADIAGSTVMFKYDAMPDDDTIQADAARYEAMMQQNAIEVALAQEQANGAPNQE